MSFSEFRMDLRSGFCDINSDKHLSISALKQNAESTDMFVDLSKQLLKDWEANKLSPKWIKATRIYAQEQAQSYNSTLDQMAKEVDEAVPFGKIMLTPDYNRECLEALRSLSAILPTGYSFLDPRHLKAIRGFIPESV